MRVNIRMMGVLREAGGVQRKTIDLPDDSTVGSAIRKLIGENEKLSSVLWDSSVDSPSPNALILVDGVEIKNLHGKDTPVRQDQEIVLLSVVHGG